jgi:hypothetical protein
MAIKERLGHSSITVTIDTYGGPRRDLSRVIAEPPAAWPRREP